MKVLFIFNPYSGKGHNAKESIKAYVSQSPHDCTLFETQRAFGPLEFLVETKQTFDVIVSIGGDGTISKTVDGMMKSQNKDAKLVVVPMGSTNEYAQSLGISFESFEESFKLIDSKETFLIDVGKMNNKHFIYVACFGNFTSVTYETPQKLKNTFGHIAYWFYGAFKLRLLRNYEFIVSVDGYEFQDNYLFGLISNAYQVARVFRYPATDINLNDGEFEVLLVRRPKSAKRFLQVLYGMLMEDYDDDMFVKLKGKEIELISKKHRSWNLDGEFGGKSNHVKISVLNKKLKVLL